MTGSRSTTERGREGEDQAVSALLAEGYELIERNYRCKLGELDVVARDGDTLVFIEVRTRAQDTFGSALDTVGVTKQRQIARVAAHYLARRKPTFRDCRFDVVGITGGELTLVRDAFRLG